MPLEQEEAPVTPRILGRTMEAMLADRAEDDRRQAELYERMRNLNQLMVDFGKLRLEHERLKDSIDKFGRVLGLAKEAKRNAP